MTVDLTDRWSSVELTPWQQQRRRAFLGEWRSQRSGILGNSARTCQRPLGQHVTVHVGSDGTTSVKGIARCGSVWSCPWCAPKVRADRAEDIASAVEAAQAVGLEVWMITATLPHRAGEKLADLRARLQAWWTDAWGGKAGKGCRDTCGVVGTIRVVEVTYGRNGWHPHIHALWFVDPSQGSMDVPRVAGRWRARFDAAGVGEKYVPRVSIDVRRVEAGDRARTTVGHYLGKVTQRWGVGMELARQDLKSRGGIHPAEMLELAACGETEWVLRWMEWERATKGWRCIVWSAGLRSLAIGWQAEAVAEGVRLQHRALDLEERSDEEAAAADDVAQVVASVHVSAEAWNWWKRQGRLAELLQQIVRREPIIGVHYITPWIDPDWRPPGVTASARTGQPVAV